MSPNLSEYKTESAPFPEGWEDNIHGNIIGSCRRNGSKQRFHDSDNRSTSASELLIKSFVLSRFIAASPNIEHVGILLPTTTIGTVTAAATMFADKIPVFLNFTASDDAIRYAIETCQIKTIVSSRKFLQKINKPELGQMAFLEDWLPQVTAIDKLTAFLYASLTPAALTKRRYYPSVIDPVTHPATILFSSGSTGTPKGVVLTHRNLISNLNAILSVLKLNRSDIILASLPLFHSFGYIGNFLLPIFAGIDAVYHPNPTDAATIGEVVEKHRCTLLFATPTFLQNYTRKCQPEQFQSLRLVISGAEKLQPHITDRFREKFGICPIEGFGCTELSPVVAINAPEDAGNMKTECGRSGSVGKAVPGVAVKIVDPENGQVVPRNEEGLFMVGGPNVMKGYLGEEERTNAVLRDGWYNTGDMARLDEDGYIFITGRYSRFSKIAGEMVPHGLIEEKIHQILNASDLCVVVASAQDPVKGEKLVVLHRPLNMDITAILSALRDMNLPNLWIPKAKDFYPIDEIPLLGSGKLDLGGIKQKVNQLTGQP